MPALIVLCVVLALILFALPIIFRRRAPRTFVYAGGIPVVGREEVRELLGLVTFAALEDLRAQDRTFPLPEGELASCGPIWWTATIVAYRQQRDHLVSMPRASS